MGFKKFFLQETEGYSLEDLLLEASLIIESDEEIASLQQQLYTTDDPEEKKRLSQQIQQLAKQKKKKSNSGSSDENKLINFANKMGLEPKLVVDTIKNVAPHRKYVDIILKWWSTGKFQPEDSVLVRQNLVNFENNSKELKIQDINQYNHPKILENALGQLTYKKTQGELTQDINDPPIYEDENIRVFHGSDRHRCIKYADGKGKPQLCIGRKTSDNKYLNFRSKGATFYFVYFLNEEANNGKLEEDIDFIVLHVYPNKMQINYVIPNDDIEITEEKLLSEFPKLKVLFDKGILGHKEHTEDEKEQFKVVRYDSILDIQNYNEMITFVEIGKKIKEDEWDVLKNEGFDIKDLVNKYMNTGAGDIPYDIIDRFKFRDRYEEMLKRRVKQKLENELDDGIWTKHEYQIINKMDNKQEILKRTSQDRWGAFRYAYANNFNNIDPVIENAYGGYEGILDDPWMSLEYARGKGFPDNLDIDIIGSIAEYTGSAYEYAKGKSFSIPKREYYIIDTISDDVDKSYTYAIRKSEWDDFDSIEPEIIETIATSPSHSYRYAAEKHFDLDFNKDKSIIRSIANNYEYTVHYGEMVKYQNLPEPIYRSLEENGNLPPNATMAKN